jgi:hypothetical protein
VIRNRKSQSYAWHNRALILDLYMSRSQAQPRLTREEVRKLLHNTMSVKTISRHLGWLRAHGHMAPSRGSRAGGPATGVRDTKTGEKDTRKGPRKPRAGG